MRPPEHFGVRLDRNVPGVPWLFPRLVEPPGAAWRIRVWDRDPEDVSRPPAGRIPPRVQLVNRVGEGLARLEGARAVAKAELQRPAQDVDELHVAGYRVRRIPCAGTGWYD